MLRVTFILFLTYFCFSCKNESPSTSQAAEHASTSDVQTSTNENNSTSSSTPSASTSSNPTSSTTGDAPSINTNSSIPQADGNVITNSNPNSNTNTTTPSPSAPQAPTASPAIPNKTTQGDKVVYGNTKKSETYSTIIPDEVKASGQRKNFPIPDPCSLISGNTIKKNFNASSPDIKSPRPKSDDKACFFKFDDADVVNAGIMLQITTNPIPDDVDDYPALVIQSKLTNGEQTPYDKEVKRFLPMTELGDGGCYSTEAGKYYWKIGDRYVFLLAFNTSLKSAQQKAVALSIGKEIMQNFNSKVK